MVSILESKAYPDPPDETFEVAVFKGYLISWDGKKAELLKQYGFGEHQAIPENHRFDIVKAIKDYVKSN